MKLLPPSDQNDLSTENFQTKFQLSGFKVPTLNSIFFSPQSTTLTTSLRSPETHVYPVKSAMIVTPLVIPSNSPRFYLAIKFYSVQIFRDELTPHSSVSTLVALQSELKYFWRVGSFFVAAVSFFCGINYYVISWKGP
jgi:hypothetical protein